MRITLLGTGDTTGTPTIGCDCGTCSRARELGVTRSRFSVHIANERTGETVLIDASPDFRSQFLARDVDLPDAALITHIHFDHLDGLGNMFRLRRSLPVFAANEVDPVTGKSVADTIGERYNYLDALDVHPVEPHNTIEVCSLAVTFLPVCHPPMVSYGLHIRDPVSGAQLGLTGDTHFAIPSKSKEALQGVDLLLADAIVPASFADGHPAGGDHHDANGVARTFGSKHMTREGALALAEELAVGEVSLVHISHFYPPEEAFDARMAVDGEEFVL